MILRHKKTILVIMMVISLVLPQFAQAEPDLGLVYASNFELIGLDHDIRDVLINVIRYLLTFLGVLAVSVILLGGFRYMIALGNEDRLAMAKATIFSGLIGLIIILSSFAIVNFIFSATSTVLNEGTVI